jgi:hypothetical protein
MQSRPPYDTQVGLYTNSGVVPPPRDALEGKPLAQAALKTLTTHPRLQLVLRAQEALLPRTMRPLVQRGDQRRKAPKSCLVNATFLRWSSPCTSDLVLNPICRKVFRFFSTSWRLTQIRPPYDCQSRQYNRIVEVSRTDVLNDGRPITAPPTKTPETKPLAAAGSKDSHGTPKLQLVLRRAKLSTTLLVSIESTTGLARLRPLLMSTPINKAPHNGNVATCIDAQPTP